MSDPTPDTEAFRYDEVPYEGHAYNTAHIDRLATLGHLFGLDTPDPRTARVLEIGCAGGGNIVPMALAYPEATFVGLDLSKVEVDEGNAILEPLGLSNIELRHANVMEVDESWGEFDYVLCHGVWTWVPDDVQDHIFDVCRRLLSPHGVAYISYNVYPGWRMRQMVRDMMLFHTHPFDSPQQKTDQARALLQFLVDVHGEEANHPYAVSIRKEAKLLSRQPDHYLYHDHLSDRNEPVYFYEFIQRATARDLAYLGDAHFSSMLSMHMPPKAREFLAQIDDLVKVEQYMDFVRQRMFRTSYLVRGDAEIKRSLDWRNVVDFHLAVKGTFDDGGGPIDDPDVIARVERGEEEMTTSEPVMKAALQLLIEHWPHTMPFEEVLRRARERYGATQGEQANRETLGGLCLSCFANNMMEVWRSPVPVGPRSERPNVFPWARVQIARRFAGATNLRHEIVALDDMGRSVLWLCDGTRDRDAIVDAAMNHARKGGAEVRNESGELITDEAELREAFGLAVDEALDKAEHNSLLYR